MVPIRHIAASPDTRLQHKHKRQTLRHPHQVVPQLISQRCDLTLIRSADTNRSVTAQISDRRGAPSHDSGRIARNRRAERSSDVGHARRMSPPPKNLVALGSSVVP